MADDTARIAFKVEADTSGVKKPLDDAAKTARRLQDEIKRSQANAEQFSRGVRRVFSTQGLRGLVGGRVRGGLGAAGGVLSGGGSGGEALLAGIGALFPEVGIALGIAANAGGVAANLSGSNARLARAMETLGLGASSARGEVANILGVAKQAGSQWQLWKSPRNILRLAGQTTEEAGHTLRKEQIKKLLKNYTSFEIAAMAPAFPPEYQDIVRQALADARQREKAQQGAAAWRDAVNPNPSNSSAGAGPWQAAVNVYTGIYAGSGMSDEQIGREIRATLDRRDRNNGNYTSTLTYRG